MLHPVGDLAPFVYWRRRVLLLAALLLALLTVYTIFFRGGGDQAPKANSSFTGSGSNRTTSSPPPTPTVSSTPPTAASTSAAPKACVPSQLTITAASDAKTYPAAAKPNLALVVTNEGTAPCVQDLSDSQIELRVYNGSARVWGSHDCQVQPGRSPSTLPVGQPIRRAVEWSGLSSQPGCAGVRSRVAAGTYTLSAYLAGRAGKTSSFSITG